MLNTKHRQSHHCQIPCNWWQYLGWYTTIKRIRTSPMMNKFKLNYTHNFEIIYLRSKNHSSQSLLFPDPIMYCGRKDAQLLKFSEMYFSTCTWPASGLTTSWDEWRLRVSNSECRRGDNNCRMKSYPFDMRRLVSWFVNSSTADEQELLHARTLSPICHRPL